MTYLFLVCRYLLLVLGLSVEQGLDRAGEGRRGGMNRLGVLLPVFYVSLSTIRENRISGVKAIRRLTLHSHNRFTGTKIRSENGSE